MQTVKNHLPLIAVICFIGIACYLKGLQMDNIKAELDAKCVDKHTQQWVCN